MGHLFLAWGTEHEVRSSAPPHSVLHAPCPLLLVLPGNLAPP
jgi:hypothetical protein